ncbi:MAG: serine/threonine-protein kinase HipA [Acidimicrobiales bacterium]|jgi:serine/threonine-protein kinase HipA
MSETLAVLLEGSVIGELTRADDGRLNLRLVAPTTNSPRTPLSVSMPNSQDEHRDQRINPWLWGLLPDNGDVLARWGRDFGVSTNNPFGLLGTQVGHDCAGAVQFCAMDQADDLINRPGDISWLTEAQIAARLRELRRDGTGWLGPGFAGQFSLGGAQAKTALHRGSTDWGLPSGSLPTTHIFKPAVAGLVWQDLNEHLCLAAARHAGLQAAATRIESFEDQTAIVVERFDRQLVDGALRRIHTEDLCQSLSVHPARKYQAEGGPSAKDIVELLRSVVPGLAASEDVWRFVDALAFNWLIAGTDAHAKNYSLLLAGTQVRLAPLYDIASILPYDDSAGRKIKLAMKIGDDYRLDRIDRRQAWQSMASDLGLPADAVLTRVHDLALRLAAAFNQAAADTIPAGLQTDFPERLTELVAERAQRCANLLC